MSLKNVREYRGMPFIKLGMRVHHTYNNKYGRISGSNWAGNLNITFDGESYSTNCHPCFMMIYFNDDGDVIAEYGA